MLLLGMAMSFDVGSLAEAVTRSRLAEYHRPATASGSVHDVRAFAFERRVIGSFSRLLAVNNGIDTVHPADTCRGLLKCVPPNVLLSSSKKYAALCVQ